MTAISNTRECQASHSPNISLSIGRPILVTIGTELFAGPIQKLFDWNDQNGAATGLRARLASIDITGAIATAGWNSTTGPVTVSQTCSHC